MQEALGPVFRKEYTHRNKAKKIIAYIISHGVNSPFLYSHFARCSVFYILLNTGLKRLSLSGLSVVLGTEGRALVLVCIF